MKDYGKEILNTYLGILKEIKRKMTEREEDGLLINRIEVEEILKEVEDVLINNYNKI